MTGTGGLETRTFFAEEITVNSTEGPTVGEYHKTVFVVGGSSANPNTVYYSALNDPTSFTGGHAVVIDDKNSRLKKFSWRYNYFLSKTVYTNYQMLKIIIVLALLQLAQKRKAV